MKITRRRRTRPHRPHRPPKLAFLMVCSAIALLAWIGMPEQEGGIATVHWTGRPACEQPPGEPAACVQPSERGPTQPPLSLFNDATGRPDPNGVMWIDPMELVRRFPEKYGGCILGPATTPPRR